jgi:catalase
MNAYGHLKAIGHTPEAAPLLKKAGVVPDEGVVAIAKLAEAATTRYFDREPNVRTLA